MASDDDGRPIDANCRRLPARPIGSTRIGFSGWIGREPHGAAKSDSGGVRDGVFAEQVIELFGELARGTRRRTVARGRFVRQPARHRVLRVRSGRTLLSFAPPDDSRARHRRGALAVGLVRGPPAVPGAVRTRSGRRCSTNRTTDLAYRRLYYFLHKAVDVAIVRVLEALEASGMADDTIVRVHVRPRRPARRARRVACRSGTTRTTKRSACRCSSRVRALPRRPAA